jgi:hypothetical protein
MQQKQKFMVPSDLLEQVKGECEHVRYRLGGNTLDCPESYKDALGCVERYEERLKLFDVHEGTKKQYCAMGMLFKALGADIYDLKTVLRSEVYRQCPNVERQFDVWGKMFRERTGKESLVNNIMGMNDSQKLSMDEIQSRLNSVGL